MQINEIVRRIARFSHVCGVILFGSAARNDAKPTSDIDLFVIVANEDAKEKVVKWAISESERIGRKIQTIVRTQDELRKVDSAFILSVIQHGKVMYLAPGAELPVRYLLPLKPVVIFSYNTTDLSPERRSTLAHTLYGREVKSKGRKYEQKGILEKCDGKRVGRATVMVPAERKEVIEEFLNNMRVKFSETHAFV